MSERPAIIRGGSVVDGTGAPPETRDVLLAGGRVRDVLRPGHAAPDDAAVLDATGKLVCPGFIDVHSHADNSPLLGFDDLSKLMQGVTTEVVGNCGFSLAPIAVDAGEAFQEYLRRLFPPMPLTWSTFAELMEVVDDAGSVTNYCPLVGHGALRFAVVGMAREADDDALRSMRAWLDEALTAGAFGMSSGLVYPPGSYSDAAEMRLLTATLGDRVYATHQRAEGAYLLDSLAEALGVARDSRCRLQISHLKSMGQPNWGRTRDALDAIDRAREAGVAVAQDVYPYTASSTTLMSLLPPEFLVGDNAEVLDRLRRPDAVDRLAALLESGVAGWENRAAYAGWDGVLIARTASGEHEGHTLAEVAHELGQEPVTTLVTLLLRERLEVMASTFLMGERDIETVLAHPWTMVGSDGLPVGAAARPHPRLYGTFPRVLGRYARDSGTVTLTEAVRRMTSLPADWFGVPDRGRIAPGQVADLVILDPDGVRDTATYTEPERFPDGIVAVLQAGRVVVRNGEYTGVRRGVRLRPAS